MLRSPRLLPAVFAVALASAGIALIGAAPSGAASSTFSVPGLGQPFQVPAGVTSITVELWGAVGGDAISSGAAGGHLTATIPVVPCETLIVDVGGFGHEGGDGDGLGGINHGGDGGSGGAPDGRSGGGGGMSDVRQSGAIVLAAGGGGGGGFATGPGGAGGGADGVNGTTGAGVGGGGGGGGTPTTPGTAGAAGVGINNGQPGTAGASELGGTGGAGNFLGLASASGGGGGGGAGYFGGGGGGGAADSDSGGGGGGGGGFAELSATGVAAEQGVDPLNGGNGQVVITYDGGASCAPVAAVVTPRFTG